MSIVGKMISRKMGTPGITKPRVGDRGCGYAVLPILLLSMIPLNALAQQPNVVLKVPTQSMEVGEAVDVTLVCTNTEKPSAPKATVPDGLELKLTNPIPSSSSRTSIVNGKRTSRISYTFSMRLTALKVGQYKLGPVTIRAGGLSYSTMPISIFVRKAVVDTRPRGNRMMFATIQVSTDQLYITESCQATLTFGIRSVVLNNRTVDIDMLRNVLNLRQSQLSVFEGGRASRSYQTIPDDSGARHRYEIFRVEKEIRGEQVGLLRIGPVRLKANYPTSVRRGFFGRMEVNRSRKEAARAQAVTVMVKAPPLAGRPSSYTGAVGQFGMTVSAKPTQVELGQPITLGITLRGNKLQGVAGPDLTEQPELISRFDFTQDEWVGDLEGRIKKFRRAIFPKQVGEQTIPPIEWSYFNPRTEKYVTLKSQPVAITVNAPTETTTSLLLPVEADLEKSATLLTVLSGGLSPNFIDPGHVLVNQTLAFSPLWIGSVVAAPVVWMVVFWLTSHRRRLQSDVSFARRRQARRRAHGRLHSVAQNGDPSAQWQELSSAVTEYLSDRFNTGSQTLTPLEVSSLLRDRHVHESLRSEIVTFLETCDALRYAPGTANDLTPESAAKRIRQWIGQLEGGA